jgi:hypothetical protein
MRKLEACGFRVRGGSRSSLASFGQIAIVAAITAKPQ